MTMNSIIRAAVHIFVILCMNCYASDGVGYPQYNGKNHYQVSTTCICYHIDSGPILFSSNLPSHIKEYLIYKNNHALTLP